jgi:UDP-glucose 4-epimerase
MKHVIVTGATGLIGSRLVKELLAAGMSVTATSRAPTRRVESELGVALVQLDVLKPPFDGITLPYADCLIHCATANDIVSKNQSLGFELSVMGTWNVLHLAAKSSIPRIIYFSTFQVYGTELTGVVDESRPTNCQSPYGLNHWFGEEVCRLQATMQAVDVAVVRPSNVYGAPAASSVNRGTLVPTCFVRDALTQGEIRLQSSGRQLRNFVSSHEVALACLHLLATFPSGFSISNICSPYSATIYDVALLTAEVHKERFGVTLPVKVLRNEPTVINHFDAQSRLHAIWGTAESSRESMRHEIRLLYESMHQSP